MKKFTYIIIAFLMALSCEQLEQFQEGLTFDDANTALLTQTVPATATSARSISFKAADVWIAEVKDAAWLTVTPGYGGAGDYTLQFKLEMNTAGQPRSGKVVLTCKSKTTEVSITQEGMPEMTVDQASADLLTQTVPATATSAQSITIAAPLSWTATVKDAPWLKVSPARGDAGTATLAFTLETNGTFQARTGKVEIICNGKTLVATITQEGLAEWEAPQAMAYVKTIGMRYVENVKANARISDLSYTLSYDSKKRVSAIVYSDNTFTNDYSQPGYIIGKAGDYTFTYTLGQDGFVDKIALPTVYHNGTVMMYAMTYSFVRSNEGNIAKITGHYVEANYPDEVMTLEYTDRKITAMIMNGNRYDCPAYKNNHALPNINVNLNAFLWTGNEPYINAMWLGYCGNMGNYLLETPMMSYAVSSSPYEQPGPDAPDGTYHYETKYAQMGACTGMKVEKDNHGCFTKITYDFEVEEWKESYDYIVSEGHGDYSNEKREKTGQILGTNQIVYSITYL